MRWVLIYECNEASPCALYRMHIVLQYFFKSMFSPGFIYLLGTNQNIYIFPEGSCVSEQSPDFYIPFLNPSSSPLQYPELEVSFLRFPQLCIP